MWPPYKYKALEPDTIRLLRILPDSRPDDIHCELVHRPIEGTNYTALSYCWGDPKPAGQLRIDDQHLNVASNLLQFLVCCITTEHVRGDMYTFLWIDAVCIDQASTEEKSAQVNIMWSIYERAGQVTAWLGDVAPPIERALSAGRALGKIIEYPPFTERDWAISVSPEQVESVRLTCGYLSKSELLDDIACLTRHDYFHRMWTYQEVMSATRYQNICFKTASSSCSWPELTALDEASAPINEEGYVRPGVSLTFHDLVMQWWVAQVAIKPSMHVALPHVILSNALLHTKDRQCLDPRDKVFALLGLPALRAKFNELKLVADYTMTPEDILIQVLLRYEELNARYVTPDSEPDHSEEIEREHNDIDEMAALMFTALKLDHYERFHRYWLHVRSQHNTAGVSEPLGLEVRANQKMMIAHTWILHHLSFPVDDSAEGSDAEFLRAVHRYVQRIRESK